MCWRTAAGKGHSVSGANLKKFLAAARKRPRLPVSFTTALALGAQVFVDVNRDQVLQQGRRHAGRLPDDADAYMGGVFVNYFNRFGRQWQVYVQAEGDYRVRGREARTVLRPEQQGADRCRSRRSRASSSASGPEFTMRYNLYRSAQINVTPRRATARRRP